MAKITTRKNEELKVNTYYEYQGPELSKDQIANFEAELDSVFNNDTLMLNRVNDYGFADLLFYCAMSGSEKCIEYFQNYQVGFWDP